MCVRVAGADPEEELEAAIQSCPVDCIHCKSMFLRLPPALQYTQPQPWPVGP